MAINIRLYSVFIDFLYDFYKNSFGDLATIAGLQCGTPAEVEAHHYLAIFEILLHIVSALNYLSKP